jgi:hypothetical protein
MTLFGWIFSLRRTAHGNAPKRCGVLKHALSTHIATEVALCARSSDAWMRRFFPLKMHVNGRAEAFTVCTTGAKRLKKRHFSITAREKTLAKVHACAIFRADSLYAATLATAFNAHKTFEE